MVMLNHRRITIIRKLLDQDSPVTIKVLSKQLHFSERTLREDLKIIDEWMKLYHFPIISKKPKVGIFLKVDSGTVIDINDKVRTITLASYELNRFERIQCILLILLTTKETLTIGGLENVFYISRGTIIKDLLKVESFLEQFDLRLCRQTKKGIWIDGNELNVRQALILICKDIDPLLAQIIVSGKTKDKKSTVSQLTFPKSMRRLVETLHLKRIQVIVDPILDLVNISLSDDGLMSLYLHIGMAMKRLKSGDFVILQKEELADIYNQKEYEIAQILTNQIEEQFKVKMPDHEIAYIGLHLISNQKAPFLQSKKGIYHKQILYQQVLKMTLIIERLLFIKFNNKESLINDLLLHIRPAIYRARFGLRVENTLVYEIKQEFEDVFNAVKESIYNIEQEYNISLSKEEIAYITIHYASAMPDDGVAEQYKSLQVLIVCNSGIGTAKLLESRIKETFANIRVMKTLSRQMYLEKSDWEADLVVSTIDITSPITPVLKVNPLLPKEDVNKLALYVQPKERKTLTSQQMYEAILPIINQHCTIENLKGLTEDMIVSIQGLLENRTTHSKFSMGSLDGVLNEDGVQLDEKIENWQEAIIYGTKPLEKKGAVPEEYKEEIVSILKERGPYMAVAPGILLAHGSANEKIEEVCLSFTRLDPPIAFGHESNDPISFLFVFASPNQNSHVPALQQLLEKLMNEENRHALAIAKTPSDVLNIFINQDKGVRL